MAITINGDGSIGGLNTITNLDAGGLPDGSVTAADLDGAQTGSAPIYGARAWVNFDGTRNEADTGPSTNGANVKIRASGNVSSVLKNATGDYTVNFTTAMSDTNYVVQLGSGNSLSSGAYTPALYVDDDAYTPTTSNFRMGTVQATTAVSYDPVRVFVAVFR